MAKNIPARERPGRRVHGKYAMLGKMAYAYPDFRKQPIKRDTLIELHAARVNAFGPGYYHEGRDLEAIEHAAFRRTDQAPE